MHKSFFSVKSFCVAALAGISFASFLTAQPSLAQLNTVEAYPGDNSQDDSNPFSPSSGNLNPLDLIHRAQFGNLNWDAQQKDEELNSAVAELNKKRARLNQNTNNIPGNASGQAVPGLPTITSPSVISPVQIVPSQN
ncbi:hypothetical protein H6G76_11395 [Nostoc sp. FACHB-152]|uniref:hypothetical protein n=1 Tax=unclassified Nostoc TaxID=2593658 RepID=UPI001686F712|nr:MULTISPECIES: hypothetical protein [unclassified Nostoc]MBD2447769.1 hypothetical protein [Nostoc sp. FACHB-152]MBD2467060.1 hypothetical protein [Nostoc sp. FACHB-145]